MNIKNSPAKVFGVILAVIIGSATLNAQTTNLTNRTGTNAVTEPGGSGSVRVESNGIHIGGNNGSPPVDINWGNSSDILKPTFGKTIIALTAILSPFIAIFGLPAAVIFTVFYFRHRKDKMTHETVRAMVERGIPVTPELIAGLNPKGVNVNIQGKLDHGRPRNRHLLPGLILIGIGLGLTVTHPSHVGPASLIILLVGLAFLIAWMVERKENRPDERSINIPKVGNQQTERKPDSDQQPPKI